MKNVWKRRGRGERGEERIAEKSLSALSAVSAFQLFKGSHEGSLFSFPSPERYVDIRPTWGRRVMRSRCAALFLLFAAAPGARAQNAGIEFFETRIRPILVEHCYECHATTSKKVRGQLLL